MGRKMDLLLGRTSRQTSKLKTLLGLTVSRLAVLRNHRQVRCIQARSDLAQLLQLGHADRALLRAEQVIKEQNMLDVFVMAESYCNLITERAILIENTKKCPEELREAISSLIFASSRCGELPELQDVRYIFATHFGKDFTAAALELRNSCGVNPKIIEKLSTRQPSLESRQRVVEEIAAEKGIKLDIQEVSSEKLKGNRRFNQRNDEIKAEVNTSVDNRKLPELDSDESFSMEVMQKYKDVPSAAQAAYESAALAASAARAAMELSRFDSEGRGSSGQSKPVSKRRNENKELKRDTTEHSDSDKYFEKIDTVQNYNSDADVEKSVKHKVLLQKGTEDNMAAQQDYSSSHSSSDSTETPSKEINIAPRASSEGDENEILFDKSDSEEEGMLISASKTLDSRRSGDRFAGNRQTNSASDEGLYEENQMSYLGAPYQRTNLRHTGSTSLDEDINRLEVQSANQSKISTNLSVHPNVARESIHLDRGDHLHKEHPDRGKKPMSVRTRRGRYQQILEQKKDE
ncbi:uncharacterized protein [Typha angustifolia]|uniref:uncharacterized protein n=1 Tax=Typha angustifolia TaxID=59011 RepID=UPI003C2F89D6